LPFSPSSPSTPPAYPHVLILSAVQHHSATFAAAAACFALVRVADIRDKTAPPRHVLADLRDGWKEFVSHTWLRVVVVAFMIINAVFYGAVMVLGPAVADQTIGRSAWGLVLAAWSAGMALGAVIAMRLRVRRLLLAGVSCGVMRSVRPLPLPSPVLAGQRCA
jgi:hypothetical protein